MIILTKHEIEAINLAADDIRYAVSDMPPTVQLGALGPIVVEVLRGLPKWQRGIELTIFIHELLNRVMEE